MIKKSLFITTSLLITHAFIVMVRPVVSSQYPLQQNTVKAQTFIYDETKQNIIVGSSLSNRLVMDSLPELYNLSFTGLGVFDGLKILSSHKKFPQNIFIEMNIIQREENENFLSYVNSPILGPLKKYIPSLRDGHQPIGMFTESIFSKVKGSESPEKKDDIEKSDSSRPVDDETFVRLLNQEVQNYSQAPDKMVLANQFEELKDRIEYLETNGVHVIFFEMPVNKKLCDLSRPKMIRDYFHQYFPSPKYMYIKIPDCSEYNTTDGVHLAGKEATRYTNYLKSNIQKLLTKK